MSSSVDPSRRAARLHHLFRDTIAGKRPVRTRQEAQLFLEAVRSQKSPSQCVEHLVPAKSGLVAVREAVRSDVSAQFVLDHTLPFLRYLSDPSVKALANGQLLEQVLLAVVSPPTFLNALVALYEARGIPDGSLYPFAWLALEVLSLRPETQVDAGGLVKSISDGQHLVGSQDHATRELGYRIQKVVQLRASPVAGGDQHVGGPGGRHDNDFADFRRIRIYPTPDEFLSTQLPYYQTAREVEETEAASRPRAHLDNQFRLLREDMLAELREDIQIAIGKKKGKRSAPVLRKLHPVGIDTADGKGKYKRSALLVECGSGLEILQSLKDAASRRKYLQDQANLLRHQAFGVVCRGQDILGFAFVDRDVDKLSQEVPVVSLQFTDDDGLGRALLAFSLPDPDLVSFVLVDTPVFAYEPVLLGLQHMTDAPLLDLVINPAKIAESGFKVPDKLRPLASKLETIVKKGQEGGGLGSPDVVDYIITDRGTQKVQFDTSQLAALSLALNSPVSLILGPPGTGKSFIGAQIVRCMYEAGLRILVLSYTNHATDQFAEDCLDAGIPESSMVRIGSKTRCSPRTAPLVLSPQQSHYRRRNLAPNVINALRREADLLSSQLQDAFGAFIGFEPKWDDIEEYLEFAEGGFRFLDALRVPTDGDDEGWTRTGKGGRTIGPDYLYHQWIKGRGPGHLENRIPAGDARTVWEMGRAVREEHHARWLRALTEERLEAVKGLGRLYEEVRRKMELYRGEADAQVVRQKKVVCCTTTGAAKHDRLIRAASPDVILVEEAGEILESHVLTALASSPTVKQLVLIGDHKQLRPKINSYGLSVEKGDGFDLNRSLFERLIRQGAAHATLRKQHRMAPEISVFARELTYPELLDGPGTAGRPGILGLRDRVAFVNHDRSEEADDAQLRDRWDPSGTASKRNRFEADMVVRCVRYLGQQGYGPDRIVVLTPYIGQVRLLREHLARNKHDPALSEFDKAELIRAGLLSEAAAKLDRKPLRVSTIDNFQGEEGDIVIASLTRSNSKGDIGFMAAPERLNVLMTRARVGVILIGNMDTFMRNRRGGWATWHRFFDLLKARGHLYDGLPVRCERHPDRTALLREPLDFDKSAPDGGCTEPCNALLKCGAHKCRSRCHRVTDHSRAECNQVVTKVCERQHKTNVRCGKRHETCGRCVEEDKEMERRARQDLKLEKERARREAEYTRQLREIRDEVEHQRRINKYHAEEERRRETLEQHRSELRALKDAEQRLRHQNKLKAEAEAAAAAARARNKASSSSSSSSKQTDGQVDGSSPPPEPDWSSGPEAEWKLMKQSEGAQSKPLDELMEMIGLEDVKHEFLNLKSKVDTALRQGISLASERFSCSMLGNPGTGKTTVARLYAQFLTELCVIPGSCFREKTGAGLANLGVSGCKGLIDEMLDEGGGVLFIDEAYQLTSGSSSYGGGAVLDYLLAEVENLRGKIVFVLAGYRKQMEGFFAHNPGLPSRFPIEMSFADYSDEELLKILVLRINKKYNGSMTCEDGPAGLYCRIVARRVGRGRGKEGFGNARAIENVLDRISRRQADRLRRERREGVEPSDFVFTKEDLIGPEPGEALAKCEAWKKLQGLVGLAAVKQAVKSLVDSIRQNYLRELAEQPPIQYSLNKVFLGNPGTGKTTVAKLYGEILVALGLLSKGEVVVKNPSDFVGAHLGQSEQQTKGILAASLGKVLVIDEAYGLYGGGGGAQGGGGTAPDPYKTAVIDTIVAEVQSVPGDDRCVLLLGYKSQMEEMFHNVNPGLSRRFPIASAFYFDDFTDEELRTILDSKIKQQGYEVGSRAAGVAMEMLKRARNRPNFGNAGEIDILLDAAKARHQARFSRGRAELANLLEARDFDEDFDRAERAETDVRKLFEGSLGSDQVVSLLEGYQETVRTMRALELDPRENIPFNFLFRGPPGTGKTTTARKMGKVFYDMGFLATAEVVECSASELIGQYVGQTGPKVRQLLDRALGKVLFVDEAYRLAEGHFAKEATDELVDLITKERYSKKLVIILAGYEADINRLMSVNTGLSSRFPDVVDFRPLTADECVDLLLRLLRKKRDLVRSKSGKDLLDLSCLEAPAAGFRQRLVQTFTGLAAQDNWASARDVQAVATAVFNKALRNKDALAAGRLALAEGTVTEVLDRMLQERAARADSARPIPTTPSLDKLRGLLKHQQQQQQQASPPQQNAAPPPRPRFSTATTTSTLTTSTTTAAATSPSKGHPTAPTETVMIRSTKQPAPTTASDARQQRDAGVSDEVWEQLQRDRRAQEEREAEYRRLKRDAAAAAAKAEAATEAARARIVARLLEEEARRREEARTRERLRRMGRCPVGYDWIRQEGGWRCAGGSHWMSDGDLGMEDG